MLAQMKENRVEALVPSLSLDIEEDWSLQKRCLKIYDIQMNMEEISRLVCSQVNKEKKKKYHSLK